MPFQTLKLILLISISLVILGGCSEDMPEDQLLPPTEYEIFQVVEEMPLFPGCEHLESKRERNSCSQEKLLRFIDSLLIMPPEVVSGQVEGTGVVTFIIDERGDVGPPKVIRSVCVLCDEQMLSIVRQMPRWIPGKQRGREVAVQFNLPMRFER
ncbi:MAG TPA: energy transducer TonB [Saprospiraceae bacterium]|nr:energy transducer TonB [Saprospiraceae bacterium]